MNIYDFSMMYDLSPERIRKAWENISLIGNDAHYQDEIDEVSNVIMSYFEDEVDFSALDNYEIFHWFCSCVAEGHYFNEAYHVVLPILVEFEEDGSFGTQGYLV